MIHGKVCFVAVDTNKLLFFIGSHSIQIDYWFAIFFFSVLGGKVLLLVFALYDRFGVILFRFRVIKMLRSCLIS